MRKSASFYFFKRKPIILENRYEHWRGVADLLRFRGCPKTRISAGRDDLNAKEKRVIIGDKREE